MATESGMENKNEKRPNLFVRIGRWFKSAALELKKTTWPKADEVFKKLGTVMIVVLFFFLVLLLMDYLLGLGYTALTNGIAGGEAFSRMTVSFAGLGASPMRGL